MFAVHLLALLISIPLVLNYIAINKPVNTNDATLTIFTYNVHGFRGFHFIGTEQQIRDSIAKAIRQTNADVACIQEFLAFGNNKEAILESFVRKAGFKYFTFKPYYTHSGNKLEGLLIMSRFPLVTDGYVSLPGRRTFAAWADLAAIPGATIRIVNIHLASFSFERKEVELLGEGRLIEKKMWEEHGSSVLSKFLNTFMIRAEEIQNLFASNILSAPSLIVAGDFNDSPSSFTYRQLKKLGLNDTFIKAGKGIGATYAGKIPLQRIDYIFVTPGFEVIHAKVLDLPYSDHYPLVSTLSAP